MCTYNISLDDQLVAQTAHSLQEGISFHVWLQQQVEKLLRAQVQTMQQSSTVLTQKQKHSQALSDEQLAERLSQFAPLTDGDFPALEKDAYDYYQRHHHGRLPKGLEKWL